MVPPTLSGHAGEGRAQAPPRGVSFRDHSGTAVELHRSAKVRGNVETASLMVEKGAFLQGEMKMAATEKDGAAKPAVSPAVALQ